MSILTSPKTIERPGSFLSPTPASLDVSPQFPSNFTSSSIGPNRLIVTPGWRNHAS